MTKADIVNEISKSTGIDRANVLDTIEKFMEVVMIRCSWRKRLSPWLRQLHHQGSFRQDCPQYLEEYHHHHPERQIPAFKPAKVFMEDVR